MLNPAIDSTNIRAVTPIYTAAMLEEIQVFRVMDILVARFQSGLLPVGRTAAGTALYEYWRRSGERLTRDDRMALYSGTFGLGASNAAPRPNREFADLWKRFLSGVVDSSRQSAAKVPDWRKLEAVRKAGRNLAANLSTRGVGFARFAGRDLADQIKTIQSVFAAEDIRSAFGAQDMWQVVEKVAASELGRAPEVGRYRLLAESGANIIAWLARNSGHLLSESARPRPGSDRDYRRLIAECEKWLCTERPKGKPGKP